MEYKDILFTVEQGVATLTLNRPEKMNAFSPDMSVSIKAAIDETAASPAIRTLVITGAGQAFCTGADAKQLGEAQEHTGTPAAMAGLPPHHSRIPLFLRQLDKPVIASVNGVAAGGGLDLACACDIRIASEKARFTSVFVRRGMLPGLGGLYFLPRLISIDKACKMVWTGEMIDAREAEHIGLVTMVVPHEELAEMTRELAEKIAKGPPLAIQAAKRELYRALETDLSTHLETIGSTNAKLWQSEDSKEGYRAFAEKREPFFQGK